MTKKFDVVIGNPPYQEEAEGTATHGKPIYHLFMEAAYEMGEHVVLITPARFLFNAGYTPKAWNAKMLGDPHLSVPHYVPNSDSLFPGTGIKGGIAVTYRDATRAGEPLKTFTRFADLNAILNKVLASQPQSLATQITSSRSYRYTNEMHKEHPQAASTMPTGEQFKISTRTFEQLDFLYHADEPTDGMDYVRVMGLIRNKRLTRWIRSQYISGPESFQKYKVVLPAANGSGALGETLSSPVVVGPGVGVTQTFITIGAFSSEAEANNALAYIKTKFVRTLLAVLKITQHNPAKTWKHVPLQDFTANSDIDWSKPISEIDQQLYAKYGLDAEEIDFVESHVKPMD